MNVTPLVERLAEIKPRRNYVLIGIACSIVLVFAAFSNSMTSQIDEVRNNLTNFGSAANTLGTTPRESSHVVFTGIETAEWCKEPEFPKIDYKKCKHQDFLFRFGVYGGLTNALHFILKGAIWALEEDVCFFVDQRGPTKSKLATRDPPQQNVDPFLERYFEPIGLDRNDPKVKWAFRWQKFLEPGYHQIQYHEYGKFSGGILPRDDPTRFKNRDIQSLYSYDKDSIWTKKWVLRRLFRILPRLRNTACSRLSAHGLQEEYMVMSVRRGDKALEYEIESSLQPYIDQAEIGVQTHFDGIVPTIFVASDDCSVMKELRELRPEWKFVGECDNASEASGFVIAEMKKWTLAETDSHYEKFITEMIAMASAKYFIGVSTTNVSLWVYFMRHFDAADDTWWFVDSDKIPH